LALSEALKESIAGKATRIHRPFQKLFQFRKGGDMQSGFVRLIRISGFFILMTACAQHNLQNVAPLPAVSPSVTSPYAIRQGDELEIKFFYNPELNERVLVRPDGMITLQLIDDFKAEGLSPFELDRQLTELYAKELRKPVLSVIVRSFAGQRIFVGGEVVRPGIVDIPSGITALQAVFQAGGFRETAEPKEAVIIRKGPENRPMPYRINLASLSGSDANGAYFMLQPDDIVYVPKSNIAELNKFVNQYIEQLLLFRGVSFGFGYSLNDNNNNN
jgi:protein involved in polysaccharide export with SLBB domain